ncbi:MAG: pyridoxamine 5'-phosphate oxidase family protein [Candidatus Thermoplasmatota archaeon]|nr:pyridoxamine 5'-phosphate oxidase family protein [Candidatus Thermoplasmatota archaeon]
MSVSCIPHPGEIVAQGRFGRAGVIATADAAGYCDCSYRGRETAGVAVDPTVLVFPDYPGNGLFNSLGNVLVNPHIGLLFIDFAA